MDTAAIELADALRFIERRAAEDRTLGLTPRTNPLGLAPKRGVKRSQHLGATARKPRTTAYGVAAFSRDPEHIERLASGNVETSVYRTFDGYRPAEISRTSRANGRILKRQNRARIVTETHTAETARHTPQLRHDFTA